MYHSQKSYIDRVRCVESGSNCYFYYITVLIIVNVVGDIVLILFLLDNTAVPYIVVVKFSIHSLAKKQIVNICLKISIDSTNVNF